MWRATRRAWNASPPGAPAGLRPSPSAPNSLTTSTRRPNAASKRSIQSSIAARTIAGDERRCAYQPS